MLQIKKQVLTEFLKKVKMDGEEQITEAVFQFNKEGLRINANSPTQFARVMAWLKSSAFEKYEEIGNVGVSQIGELITVLGRFGDKITLDKQGNLLTIKGDNKSVDVELVSENFLKTDTGEPKLEFTETFHIESKQLNGIFDDVKLNTRDSIILIETHPKNVSFKNTGKYKFNTLINAPSCTGGSNVKFGSSFINAVKQLDGALEVSVKTNYPIKVMQKLDNEIISVIVAPRVDEE